MLPGINVIWCVINLIGVRLFPRKAPYMIYLLAIMHCADSLIQKYTQYYDNMYGDVKLTSYLVIC
jgi:hypothetical protein